MPKIAHGCTIISTHVFKAKYVHYAKNSTYGCTILLLLLLL